MFRHGLYGTAAAMAIIYAAPVAIAQNDPAVVRADVLINRMPTLIGDMATLRADIDRANTALPATYACPPAAPNRTPDRAAAQAFSQRANLLRREVIAFRREFDAVNDIRSGLGETGANRLATQGVTEPIVKSMEQASARLGPQINTFSQAIENRPLTEAECQGTADPISSITFNAPSAEPGRRANVAISAKTASGAAVNISGVTFTGVNQFATVQNLRTPGGAASATFKIDDVRRQGPFTGRVSVTGTPAGAPAGATGTTYSQAFTYTVANAAPTIVSIPAAPKAEPGEDVSLDGELVVIDTNADVNNAREITNASITLGGHPAGLLTTPDGAFNRNLRVSNRRHDPATGQYTFTVKRSATAKYPHAHGVFASSLSVSDAAGKSADQPFNITIENVNPEASFTTPGRAGLAFHSGDGKSMTVAGRVKDANGREDITSIEIDATAAGGGTYKMHDGVKSLDVSPAGADAVTFKIDPAKFPHTDNSGRHDILGSAGDDGAPEQGVAATPTAFKAFITVGNNAPTVGAIGFMTGTELIIAKRVCPGELITVGATVKDAEGDVLKVTATILPGGAPQVLQKATGSSTYTGVMVAPAAPGTYTIRYDAVETATNAPKKHDRAMELTVLVCDDAVEDPKVALGGEPEPEDKVDIAVAGAPAENPAANVATFSGGYAEFDADGFGEITAGTLVPAAGGDEIPLVSAKLDKWDGWYLGGSVNGPTLWGRKTRWNLEYGEYKSDANAMGSDPENGTYDVALTYANEFAFGSGTGAGTSTGLFLGAPFGLDGTAEGQGDLFYLKFGLDHAKWSNEDVSVRGGANLFHRKIETELRSVAAVSFGGAPFGNISQENQIETQVEQIGAAFTLGGRYDVVDRVGWQPGFSLNLSGILELMNSDAQGRFGQMTWCDPGVCGVDLSNVVFAEDLDESGFEVGGSFRLGAALDISEYLSLGAGYRYGRIPGVPTFIIPTSPTLQPGEWSTDSGEFDGFDLSLQLRTSF